jgi:hypothetical protein
MAVHGMRPSMSEATMFFGVVGVCFCWGFCENVVEDCGFLMVKSWWDAGK